MKKIFFILSFIPLFLNAQFKDIVVIPHTKIKNQHRAGICWAYATVSFLESEIYRKNGFYIDLSEQYFVYKTYIDKAKMYVWLYGHTQFSTGGLAHDVMSGIKKYGILPEDVYPTTLNNDKQLFKDLQNFLDSILKFDVIPENWQQSYIKILDKYLKEPPENFKFKGKKYNAKSFAYNYLDIDPNDYMEFTSFSHHNYFEPIVLEIPDNWMRASMWNIPIKMLVNLTMESIKKGYSVVWDADVSEEGFDPQKGIAELTPQQKQKIKKLNINNYRQKSFDNHTTSDDHLMHIIGLAKKGKNYYFKVKNSWGEIGTQKGYVYVSLDYFMAKTISVMVHKQVITKEIKEKIWGENEKEKD